MKTSKLLGLIFSIMMLTCSVVHAQTGDLTIVVKGIKEAKGKLMIAFGEQSRPKEMVYGILPITSKNDLTYALKELPVGHSNLYVYQDLNENQQLDKDENQIPIEPCYRKEKITIKEGANSVEIRLINVREMMGAK